MAAPPIKPQAQMGASMEKDQKIRITLTGREVTSLERACTDLKKQAQIKQIKVKGPVRMPTKVLRLTVRKSPCGEGTNTWDRFQMRIHKRILDLTCTDQVLSQITKNCKLPGGVDVELTISA